MSDTMLSDATAIRALMRANLLGVFNERDGAKRRAVIAKRWEREGVFIGPDAVMLVTAGSRTPPIECK